MNLLNQSIIKHKMGLLNLAEELRNVSLSHCLNENVTELSRCLT
jgi:hypothetical protein